jgi:nuclear migration protein JNM1
MEYSQLQNLFNILPRLDPLLPILDPLLTRLKSLQSLHAESGEVAEGLKKLQSTQKGHDEERRELKEVVDNVQKGIGEAVGGIERNWKSLETRLESLDKRIKDLA